MKQIYLKMVLFLCISSVCAKVTAQNDVVYVQGSSVKINQLVGDWDNERTQTTQNQTWTNYGVPNTDLGVPFEHNGVTYVAFGDIFLDDRDPLAYTTDTNPDDGITLDFVTEPNGTFRPVQIPGVNLGGFGVPFEGVSWNSAMYIYASNAGMVNSVVAKSTDNGYTFTKLYDLSNSKFINVSIVKSKSTTDYPETLNSDIQVMFGSGTYRQSDVYLAYQRSDVMDTRSIGFFAGMSGGNPTWSDQESDAVALFSQSCVGEISVSYNEFIDKWIMLYNCGTPRGINCRTADDPWGPWSDPFLVFDPDVDDGYCHFIHKDWNEDNCDSVHDSGREYEWGGEYGPYQFENLAKGDDHETTIYYTLSTWNPYTVVLMKSTIRKKEPLEAGTYKLIARHSNKALDNSGYPDSADRNVVQWEQNGFDYQNWELEPVGDGYYKITSAVSGEVLDLSSCGASNGTNVQQWTWGNNDCQKWLLEEQNDGYFKLISKETGKVLEVNGSSQANGGNVQQWDWNGGNWQQWRIEPVITSGVYKVTVKHSYKALDNGAFPGSGNRNVVQWDWYDDDIQKWQFDPVGDGFYKITSEQSGEVLDLSGCGVANGTNVQQWVWLDNDCQKWKLEYLQDGYFRMVSKSSGKVLEVNGSPNNGGNVQQWEWLNLDWQKWKLERLSGPSARIRSISEEQPDLQPSVSIFPNPVSNQLRLSFEHFKSGRGQIKILDVSGQIILDQELIFSIDKTEYSIPVLELSGGLYLVKINIPGQRESITKKILVE